jgi:hypothetical protein
MSNDQCPTPIKKKPNKEFIAINCEPPSSTRKLSASRMGRVQIHLPVPHGSSWESALRFAAHSGGAENLLDYAYAYTYIL